MQAPQAGAPITVWVKRTDVTGVQYVEVENVDLEQTVSKFKARWIAQEQLDVRPSLVTLRLVESSGAEPTPDEEEIAKNKAKELSPRLTLAKAGLTDGCSLLAFVAGNKSSEERLAMSASTQGAYANRCIRFLTQIHCSHCVAASAMRLSDYARLEPTSEKDLYFLGPAGSGPRAFFLDADGVVISQAKRWIELARRKWRGVMNENDPTAVSMSITGTPKVRVCA